MQDPNQAGHEAGGGSGCDEKLNCHIHIFLNSDLASQAGLKKKYKNECEISICRLCIFICDSWGYLAPHLRKIST